MALPTFVARLLLPPIEPHANLSRAEPCPSCGSTGSNVHQHTARRVLDPRLDQVLVTRLACKVCGYVRRQYPVGVESGRLSLAMIRVCRLLRAFGLSYASLRLVLSGLGCPVSVGSLHRAANGQLEPPSGRLRLGPSPGNPTHLVGPDGGMRLSWSERRARPPGLNLVIEIAAGPEAAALRWRLERAIQACWIHTKT